MSETGHDDVMVALDRNGLYAAACGILAMTFGLTMGCTCYLSIVFGVASGAIAIVLGQRTRAAGAEGAARAYANVGLVTGAIGLGWNLLIGVLIALYLALYVVFLLFMVIASQF